jgi:hypothetical protein
MEDGKATKEVESDEEKQISEEPPKAEPNVVDPLANLDEDKLKAFKTLKSTIFEDSVLQLTSDEKAVYGKLIS